MSKNAKRLLTTAVLLCGMTLPALAALPPVIERKSDIGCVSVSTIGDIGFIADENVAVPGKSFGFGLTLGENWVLRGIEIFDKDKNPLDFDITGIYRYSFTLPKDGASIFARAEDHALTTRAECVTALWEIAGKPVVDYLMLYTDVSPESDYCEAVRWAASEGLITAGEKFRPDDQLTREELAVVIYRGAKKLGLEDDNDICALPESVDRDSVSDWATEAVCWNISEGVMNEFSGASGYFKPQEAITRYELSDVISSLMKLSDEKNEDKKDEEKDDKTCAPAKSRPINAGLISDIGN